MNVIVSNKQKDVLDNSSIDAIKDLNGLFAVNDLINNFKNYYYTKMILDATAIVDFVKQETLDELVKGIGADKLIILLPPKPEPPRKFMELLLSLGILNFATTIEEVVNMIEYPRDLDAAKKYVYKNDYNSGVSGTMNTINANPFDNPNNVNNNFAPLPNNNMNPMSNDMNNTQNNNSYSVGSNGTINPFDNGTPNPVNNMNQNPGLNPLNQNMNQSTINPFDNGMQNPNMNNNPFDQNFNNTQNTSTNPFNQMPATPSVIPFDRNVQQNPVPVNNPNPTDTRLNDDSSNLNYSHFSSNKYVLGIQNLSKHAGTTTFIYMLKKELEKKHHKKVIGIEINGHDLAYFRDANLISVTENALSSAIDANDADIVLLDLNNNNCNNLCSDIIYLLEPSIIRVNEIMSNNKMAFLGLHEEKIVLNKSLLIPSDIQIFENEAKIKFFANVPPLNDRINNNFDDLINKLKLDDQGGEKKSGFLGIFS